MMRENIGICRSCGKRIRFIKMQSGKSMPVDDCLVTYKVEAGGKDKIVTQSGTVVSGIIGVGLGMADGVGYISHFATCPKAGKRRNG